jgi:hypothetical protein
VSLASILSAALLLLLAFVACTQRGAAWFAQLRHITPRGGSL